LCGQVEEVTTEILRQRLADVLHAKVQDVLNNIISESILHKRQSVVFDLCDELELLLVTGVVNAPLHHTATMTMGGHLNAVLSNSVVDKLVVVGLHFVNTLLNDVVAIEVLNQSDYAALESFSNKSDLFGRSEVLYCFLDSAGTVHVLRDCNQVRSYSSDNGKALLRVAVLDKLLAKVISERICM
jgi:hypothetical protein